MYYHSFMHENALNPMVFPSLCRFEVETVAMAAHMLHGDGAVVGSVTSGGTESILMAVKTYRDRARSLFPHISQPEMVTHTHSLSLSLSLSHTHTHTLSLSLTHTHTLSLSLSFSL